MESEVFNYLYPNENDKISDLKYKDKNMFLKLLKNYYIEYRDVLNINRTIPFGPEIEFENADIDNIEKYIYNTYFKTGIFELDTDITLNNGGEINTPVLYNNKATWEDFKILSEILNKYSTIDVNSSFHVHVCSKVFEDNSKYLLNFLRLWGAYENIIFRFLYGEYCNERPNILKYANPILNDCLYILNIDCKDIYKIKSKLEHTRHQAVNFCNVKDFITYLIKNTIEIRVANGSLNPIIWQNIINFIISLIEYSKSENYNETLINNRIYLNEQLYNSFKDEAKYLIDIEKYSKIYEDQALELSDLIFNTNLDKVNFLRQYFKDFTESDRLFTKSKCFTK